MNRLCILSITFLFLVSALVFPGGEKETPVEEAIISEETKDTVVMIIQYPTGVDHSYGKACRFIKEQIERNSNREIAIKLYSNEVLAQQNWKVAMEQTQEGICHMCIQSTIPIATLVPKFNALNAPFLFEDMEHTRRFMANRPQVVDKWFKELEDERNLKAIAIWPRPPRQLINSRRPIKTPQDIKGLKFRVPGLDLFITIFESMGAKPVPLPPSEMYTAIQLGTVVGEDNAITTVYDYKTYEVCKYMNIWNYMVDSSIVLINNSWFESLSHEHQKIIEQAINNAGDVVIQADAESEEIAIKEMKESGIEFTYFTEEMKKPFKELMGPAYDMIIEVVGQDTWEEILATADATR